MAKSEKYGQFHWGQAPAVYSDHTLKIDGRDVMEDWEEPYMARLASVACRNGGTVLELGYGMGISCKAVQSHDIETHYVVECHPDVAKKCLEDNRAAFSSGRMHLLAGFWQDVTRALKSKSVDGILFDTYPVKDEELIGDEMFFFGEAFRLLKPGGVFTYFSDEATHYSDDHLRRLTKAGFRKEGIGYELCDVNPPEGCDYWDSPTILVPVIRKL